MKVAISGKERVGKTTFIVLLSRTFAKSGYSVLAIDAFPNVNLAATIGFIPYEQASVEAGLTNLPVLDSSQQIITRVRNICLALLPRWLGMSLLKVQIE